MNLSTLIALETLVDLTTVVLSLLAMNRCIPRTWKTAMTAALKSARPGRPKSQPAPKPGAIEMVLPPPGRTAFPVPGLAHYDQIPVLAATGLGPAQIVQRLRLTRSEVELGLKMARCRQADTDG